MIPAALKVCQRSLEGRKPEQRDSGPIVMRSLMRPLLHTADGDEGRFRFFDIVKIFTLARRQRAGRLWITLG
jgi:hypothetical protein